MTDQKQWQMPEWERDLNSAIGFPLHGKISHDVHIVLEQLHSAGLLITPGEKQVWDDCQSDLVAYDTITRLRAELDAFSKLADGYLKDNTRLRAENAILRKDLTVLLEGKALVYCACCGERFTADTDAEKDALLLVHIETCKKHPLMKLRAENERLREGLSFIAHASIVPLYYRDIADTALGADHD